MKETESEKRSKRNEPEMCCIDQIDIESFTLLSKMDVINRCIKAKKLLKRYRREKEKSTTNDTDNNSTNKKKNLIHHFEEWLVIY